ncbi:ABC transporter permease [Nocardioidaceae bacterium]|nr:ABC transporter permease [Nocardioidaceae bacterium]
MTARLGRPPGVLLAVAVLASAFLVVPLVALVADSPWQDLPDLLTDPLTLAALRLSVVTSLVASGLCLVLGLPLAWVLARVDFPGRRLLRALVLVPLVLPPVVAGVALLTAFGRTGLLGDPLREASGLTIPYTSVAVVLAHTFVALPFFVLSVEGALRARGPAYDVVAASLGASRLRTFTAVTVPMVGPGIGAGLVLAWARSLGEFGATITFAGNFPRTTQTMPSLIYTALQADPAAARALSLLLLAVSIGVLAALRTRWLGAP